MEETALKEASRLGVSYAEIRVEERWGDALEVKNGNLEKAVHGRERGGSVRVLVNGRWGFSSTNKLDKGLVSAVETAVKLAKSSSNAPGETVHIDGSSPAMGEHIMVPKKDPGSVDVETKHELLKDMDATIRESEIIKTVTASYSDGTRAVRILSTNGTEAYSEETRVVAQAVLVAREESNVVGYRFRIGGTQGYEIFDDNDPIQNGEDAAKAAARILRAPPCPAGKFPVVADPELTGVFVHEALGHAVEGDAIAAGGSVLTDKLGDRLGPEELFVYDDPTYPRAFGTYPFDQEGTPALRKAVIENGILKTFLLDRESAKKLGLEPNGSARAEDYSSVPQPRMSNTYIGQGDMKFEELVEDIKLGIYAKGTRGGQVDTTKGSFQFGAQEAYLIENGEVTKPLRDMSLSGNIIETLGSINGIGNDFHMGDPGFCGKGGQLVPVGDGGPHIRIHMATVGGGDNMFDQSLSLEQIKDVSTRAVDTALSNGADQAEAFVSMDVSLSCGIENDAVKGVGTGLSMGIGIRVLKARRMGFSYATSEEHVPEAVEQALHLSRLSKETEIEFPDASTPPIVKDIYDPTILNVTPEDLVEQAKEMLVAVKQNDGLIALDGGVGCGIERFAVASSNGMEMSAESTDIGGGIYTLLEGLKPSTGFHFAEGRMSGVDLADAAKKACKMAIDSQNPTNIEPGLMPVIFMPHAISSMLEFIIAPAFYGSRVKQGESFYAGKEGEEVASKGLDIFDDALLPNGLNSSPIDDEGTPSRRINMVEKGVFSNALYDRGSALENDDETTGSAVRSMQWSTSRSFKSPPSVKARNIVIEHESSMDIDDLIREVKKGLLVYDVLGAHTANPASGDFSVNSSMVFKISNGEITGAGDQVMLSGNLPELLNDIIGVDDNSVNVSGGLSPISFRLPAIAINNLIVT